MLVPEIIIYRSLKAIYDLVAKDYTDATNKSDTILNRMFELDDDSNAIVFGGTDDWNARAAELFTRGKTKVRNLDFYIGYNKQRSNAPSVHILLPNESNGVYNEIGNGEDGRENYIKNYGTDIAPINKVIVTRKRTKKASYHLMITSDNTMEVLITYYFLQGVLLMFSDHFELSGIKNLSYSGADLFFDASIVPDTVFHRNLNLNFDYQWTIQNAIPLELINAFNVGMCADWVDDINNYNNTGSMTPPPSDGPVTFPELNPIA